MTKLKEAPSLAELTGPCEPSTGPDYIAWKDAKVRKALEGAKDRSAMIPAHKVWEMFGFER